MVILARRVQKLSDLELISKRSHSKFYTALGILNVISYQLLYIPLIVNCSLMINLSSEIIDIAAQILGVVIIGIATVLAGYNHAYRSTLNWFSKSFMTVSNL